VRLARDHPIECRCGQVRGTIAAGAKFTRAICYCRDCQAFAAALGAPAGMLDAKGGTDVVATLPRDVRFTAGADRLACLSLTDHGLLRWYASCCRAPIGNTPRNPKISYVGLVHSCLGLIPARSRPRSDRRSSSLSPSTRRDPFNRAACAWRSPRCASLAGSSARAWTDPGGGARSSIAT